MGRYFNWEGGGPESPLRSGFSALERGIERGRQLDEQERQRSLMAAPFTEDEILAREILQGRTPTRQIQSQGLAPGGGVTTGPGQSLYNPWGEAPPPTDFEGVTAGARPAPPEKPLWGQSQVATRTETINPRDVLARLSPESMQRVAAMMGKQQSDTPEDRMARALLDAQTKKDIAVTNAETRRFVATQANGRADQANQLKLKIAEAWQRIHQSKESRLGRQGDEKLTNDKERLRLMALQVQAIQDRLRLAAEKGDMESEELARLEEELAAAQEGYKAIVGTYRNLEAPEVQAAGEKVSGLATAKGKEVGRLQGKRQEKRNQVQLETQKTTPTYPGAAPAPAPSPSPSPAPPLPQSTDIQEPTSSEAVDAKMVPPGYRLLRNKKTGETKLVKE